jgi:hypothetical protein
MPTPICRPCIGLGCDNPDDLATGIDSALYSALDYSFIEQCPEGCYCPPGLFPRTISVLASTIPPVIPPIQEPGAPIILRLQGCASLITRTLEFGSTQAEIAAAAQSMQSEWAGQQAICLAMQVPGVNCTPSNSISICNDAQNFVCSYTGQGFNVAAGIYCQTLSTIGLTQAQIDAASAAIKASLNLNARNSVCPFGGIICTISSQTRPPPGEFSLVVSNAGTTDFDSSSFKMFRSDNTLLQTSLHASVLVGQSNIVILDQVFGLPPAAGVYVTYNGVIIFTTPNNFNVNSVFTSLVANCAG